jgi:hypothetical protein
MVSVLDRAGSIPTEVDGFLRVIKIRSTTSFAGEVKASVPCRIFTACKRTLVLSTSSARKQNSSGHFSPKSPDCLPDGSGGHIRIELNSAASLLVTELTQMRKTK